MSVVTLEEFLEILNEEQHLDLAKLRNYARHGIHPQVRGEVWLYLLGVLSSDKSQEMTAVRSKFLEYESVSKRIPGVEKQIRTEVLRYFRQRMETHQISQHRDGASMLRNFRAVSSAQSLGDSSESLPTLSKIKETEHPCFPRILPSTQYGLSTMRSNSNIDDSELISEQRKLSQSVENVLCAYLNRHLIATNTPSSSQKRSLYDSTYSSMQIKNHPEYPWLQNASGSNNLELDEFHPSLVYLCAPFAQCVRAEAGMYFAFEKLMAMIEEYNQTHPLSKRVASFMTLFRTTLPELHEYFEAEEVDLLSVATSWLQHLLAREMQMDDLMRLWDTYFAVPDLLDLHLFVCLAILTYCKDALEDLDRSETMSMLCCLPPLDVDRIISDAVNIRLSLEHDEMYE
ncbi:ankyrin repeat-containing protein [Malassezia pachydermatis]|uniref:Ankyrin repeat-containing protein n=1 Tax=Malassezia pachydermatis TaxID=77020 RepID=A0A0N0RS20_9BASI|nr:ankyrin repeat-containing protein [Malassezia pachydermatis]KOS13422.1 ankyrin repeat-containing protein [Malassezia pachydermatis]